MGFLIASLVALAPLAMAPNFLLYFETIPKTAIILIGAGVLLLNLRKFEPGIARLASSTGGRFFMLCILAQCVFLVLSSSVSEDKNLAFLGTAWRRFGSIEQIAILLFGLLAAAWYAENSDSLLTLLRAVGLTGIAASTYGILQYLGRDPFTDAARYSVAYGGLKIIRPPSSMGHADYFANYLVVIIFLTAALITLETSRRAKAFAAFSSVLSFIALLLTGTRGGLAGLAAGALVFGIRIRPRITKEGMIGLVAVAAALAGAYASPVGKRLHDRVMQWHDDPKGGTRLLLWRDSLKMAKAHPWLGVGPELFATEFPKYESLELARAFPEYYHESPHNFVLDALFSQGLPGFLMVLLAGFLGVLASFHWKSRTTASAIAAALVGLFVSLQFSVFVLTTALLYYTLAAILVAGAPHESSAQSPAVRILQIVAMPLAMLFAVAGLQLVHIDARWAAIQRAIRGGRIEDALAGYNQVERMYPPESGLNLWYSRAITDATSAANADLKNRVWRQAIEAAARATQVSEDRHNAYYNLAVFYSAEGRPTEAERALSSAVECAPQWYKPHWLMAEELLSSGNLELAAKEAQTAIDLNGQSSAELSDTLRRIRLRQATK